MKKFASWICAVIVAVIWLSAAKTSSTRTVIVTEGTNVNVTVSPDRKTIIMDLQETLWSLPIAGGAAKRLTDPFLEPARPDWSPKGDLVAFQSFKGGTFHIWLMKPDGTGVRQLTDGHGDDRGAALLARWKEDRIFFRPRFQGQLRYLGRRRRQRQADAVDLEPGRRIRAGLVA